VAEAKGSGNVNGKSKKWLPRAHPISWWMLVITTLSILLNAVDRQILPTVTPAIMKEFNINSEQAGWLNSLSFIGTLIGAVVFGIVADTMGKGYRRTWSWMFTALFTIVAGIATFVSRGLGSLQFWRVIMGVGTGAMEPVNTALVGEYWQKENRGFAVGVHHTGFPFGQFLGPVMIGGILAIATWRHTFLWIPAIAIFIVVLQIFVGRKKNQQRAYNWMRENDLTVPIDENEPVKVTNPLKHIRIALTNKNVLLAIVSMFMFFWAEAGVTTFLTLQLTDKIGLTLAIAAVISGATGITGWIGQVFWGTLSDRIGRKLAVRIITGGWVLALLGFVLIHSAQSAWLVLLFWGLFRNSPFPVMYALVIDSVPEAAGSGMGLMIGIALGLSGFFAAPISGSIIDHLGYTWNYLLMAAVCALAFIPLAFLRETSVLSKNEGVS
jgi:MFS family permease